MNITTAKADLVKKILNTEDKEIISYITAIFDSQPENWFEELPESVQVSVKVGLKQAERSEGRPHSEILEKYKND